MNSLNAMHWCWIPSPMQGQTGYSRKRSHWRLRLPVPVETQKTLRYLVFGGGDTYPFTAGIGKLHTDSMLEILASVRACEDKSFSELGNAILERRPSLSGW